MCVSVCVRVYNVWMHIVNVRVHEAFEFALCVCVRVCAHAQVRVIIQCVGASCGFMYARCECMCLRGACMCLRGAPVRTVCVCMVLCAHARVSVSI